MDRDFSAVVNFVTKTNQEIIIDGVDLGFNLNKLMTNVENFD